MQRGLGITFAAVVLGLYLILSVPLLSLTFMPSWRQWLIFAVLYESLALGVAIELTELIFVFFLPPQVHPKTNSLDKSIIRLAVLYTCCDDVDQESLQKLSDLHGVDIYILDDSVSLDMQELLDRTGLPVLRRPERIGFKGGNLNNWLKLYGQEYDYFIVLDSDSIISIDSIWELVAFAEHPDNQDVAIIQSSIYPRTGNTFQRFISCQISIRLRILSHLHDRIGWSLSHGHNNLHRMRAIQEVGGFDLSASCEDTLVSIQLSRRGWRIIFVDTASFDYEPRNVFIFRKRLVRWARQTADVITTLKGRATWPHTWLLARHLFSYLLPSLCIFLLAFVSVSIDVELDQACAAFTNNFLLKPGYVVSGLISYLIGFCFSAIIALRLYLFKKNGDFRTFLLSTLLYGAVSSFCSFHILWGVLRSLLVDKVRFLPTGAADVRSLGFFDFWSAMAIPWIMYVSITFSLLCKPGLLIMGLNFLWAFLLISSPVVLYFFHKGINNGISNSTPIKNIRFL